MAKKKKTKVKKKQCSYPGCSEKIHPMAIGAHFKRVHGLSYSEFKKNIQRSGPSSRSENTQSIGAQASSEPHSSGPEPTGKASPDATPGSEGEPSDGSSFAEHLKDDLERSKPAPTPEPAPGPQGDAKGPPMPHPPIAPTPEPPSTGYAPVGTRNLFFLGAEVMDAFGDMIKEENVKTGEMALYYKTPMNERIAGKMEHLFEAAYGQSMDPAKAFWASIAMVFGPQLAMIALMILGKDMLLELRGKIKTAMKGGPDSFMGKFMSRFGGKDGKAAPVEQ